MRNLNLFFRLVCSIFPQFLCDNFYLLSKFSFLSNNPGPHAAYIYQIIIFKKIIIWVLLIHSSLNCFFNLANVFSLEHSSQKITSPVTFLCYMRLLLFFRELYFAIFRSQLQNFKEKLDKMLLLFLAKNKTSLTKSSFQINLPMFLTFFLNRELNLILHFS